MKTKSCNSKDKYESKSYIDKKDFNGTWFPIEGYGYQVTDGDISFLSCSILTWHVCWFMSLINISSTGNDWEYKKDHGRDELQMLWTNQILDDMDIKTMMAILYDNMSESYDKYSWWTDWEKLKHTYPDLLE